MQLKIVLLPDPFGPISPRISPSATSKETSLTARRAPNLLTRPVTLSIGMGCDFPSVGVSRARRSILHDAPQTRDPGFLIQATGVPHLRCRVKDAVSRAGHGMTSPRVGVPLGQRQHRIDRLDARRPGD